MVVRHSDSDEYTPHEYGLVERNLAMYGDLKFRTKVVRSMQKSVREQMKLRVQTRIHQGEFEPARTIRLSHEMTDTIIGILREPAFDENSRYITAREDLQSLINSYDEVRREEIIAGANRPVVN